MEARQGYSWHTEDCVRWALAELWFPISLEQEMNDMEPHTGTSEAEINSGSSLICFVSLAKFLLHGDPPVFLVRWGTEPVNLADCPSPRC